jgi:hypothetical protein
LPGFRLVLVALLLVFLLVFLPIVVLLPVLVVVLVVVQVVVEIVIEIEDRRGALAGTLNRSHEVGSGTGLAFSRFGGG